MYLPVSETPTFSVGINSSQPLEALLETFCVLSSILCLMLKKLT